MIEKWKDVWIEGRMSKRKDEWVSLYNIWMNEWISERMKEWMNEWMRKVWVTHLRITGEMKRITRIPGDTSKPGVTHKTRGGGRIKGGIEGGTFFKIKIQIRLKILR